MPITVDELQIKINAEAVKANNALDKLDQQLGALQSSLGNLDANKVVSFGNAVKKLSQGMSSLKVDKIGKADFTRLAGGIERIASVDADTIKKAASAMHQLNNSMEGLKKIDVSTTSKQIADLARGISQLGYKSATQAINNMPKLAQGMSQMMATLSKAPKVSRNLINMTNALAKLARTGASSGKAATSLGKSLDTYTNSTSRARKGTFSLSSAIGKLYATYWLLFRAFGKISDSIDLASSLTEVQNVVNTTFGDYADLIDKMADTSIADFGMSELTTKQVASRFQAMGTAMGFSQGKMADMSVELTKLTADMASFYNVEQEAVAEDLAAIFTGETRPLRDYGLDLTQATLAEWAMKQGLDANIQSMSQAEKALLRYQYVLANTGAAQGDFARTANTWANQVRILKQNFEALGIVVGKTLINALKPLVQALNSAMSHIIAFAETVSNALGKIFGWKFESVIGGGVVDEMAGAADSSEDIASGLGTAADNAKKLKSHLLGIDELNVLEPDTDSATGTDAGSGIGGGAGTAAGGQWTKTETIWESFESEIDSLFELGEHIGQKLTDALNSIPWDEVYQGARNFGKGLADFLNGLISPELFGAVGRTIAGALNTAIYAALEFGKTFDFYGFGESIATGINEFFDTFDFESLAETLNVWVDGIKDTIAGFLDTLTWKKIISATTTFLGTLELDTVAVLVGGVALKNSGSNLAQMITSAVLSKLISGIQITLPSINVVLSGIVVKLSGALSLLNPGIIGELGQWLQRQLDGTIFDTSTWTGLAKNINDAINELIDTIGKGLVDAMGAFGEWLVLLGGALSEALGWAWEKIKGVFSGEGEDRSFEEAGEYFASAFDGNEIGKNILLGIVEGLGATLDLFLEPINNIFSEVWDALCSVFGIHSPATEMEPIGENIMLGIVQGFTESITEFTSSLDTWFDTSIKPWFTAEKWYEVFEGIKQGFDQKWQEIQQWWSESAIGVWWTEHVQPWFTVDKWQTELENVKNAFKSKWDEIVNQWKTGIQTWWTVNVQPWFTKTRWMELLLPIAKSFSERFQLAKDWVVEKVQAMYDFVAGIVAKIRSLINSIASAISNVIGSAKSIGSSISANLGLSVSVPGYAAGGFPERSSLFYAGENGVPELLGTVGGRTAVAGGDEITGIREAVYETGSAETALLETVVGLLQIIADKDTTLELDGREIITAIDERRARNGYVFSTP